MDVSIQFLIPLQFFLAPLPSLLQTVQHISVRVVPLLWMLEFFHPMPGIPVLQLKLLIPILQEITSLPLQMETDVPEPVSYTHLRAHETGRNLVCRLLLEKK